jgi:hypothetical protein
MLSHSLRAWIADVPFAAVQPPRGLEFEYLSVRHSDVSGCRTLSRNGLILKR